MALSRPNGQAAALSRPNGRAGALSRPNGHAGALSRTGAHRAAEAYAAVDRATRSRRDEPLWLPAAWLAVVLTLTAAAPSFGGDGWRARGPVGRPLSTAKPQAAGVRQVAFEDDIAGPAIRTPRGAFYDSSVRGAQEEVSPEAPDPLRDSFQRPFGVEEPRDLPLPAEADEADRLFEDLPEEPDPLPAAEEGADDRRVGSPELSEPSSPSEGMPPAPDRSSEEPDDDDSAFERETAEKLAKERVESVKSCAEGLAQLKASRLDMIDLRIGVNGSEGEDFPYNCSLDDGSLFAPRCWCEVTYMWKASGLCHKPLYFEQVQLERYGHSWGPIAQPILSGAHFFGTLPVLPYKMGLQAPNECVYALGYYRPGSCAPYLLDPIPFTWRAALVQAGATVGVAGILP